jgi:hypothetical protein
MADTIEKLENLDRALTPEAHRIAEARCVHCTMLAMTGTEDRCQIPDCLCPLCAVRVGGNGKCDRPLGVDCTVGRSFDRDGR